MTDNGVYLYFFFKLSITFGTIGSFETKALMRGNETQYLSNQYPL